MQNWRDLVTFHIAFVKEKYSKTWIEKLYKGISESEVSLLEEIYDKVPAFPKQSIKENHINLLMIDGSTQSYKVYTVSFKEGTLFAYALIRRL